MRDAVAFVTGTGVYALVGTSVGDTRLISGNGRARTACQAALISTLSWSPDQCTAAVVATGHARGMLACSWSTSKMRSGPSISGLLVTISSCCMPSLHVRSTGIAFEQGQESTGQSPRCTQHNKDIVLPLPQASAGQASEPVTQTAWCSQSADRKLAAAAGSTIAVFALEPWILNLDAGTAIEVLPDQVASCQAVHSHPVVALSWTQEADGLLSADSQGCVTMWSFVSATDRPAQLVQAWTGGNSTVVQAQSILTAGANIHSPSASACPGTRNVTIWWPQEFPQDEAGQQHSTAPAMVAVAEQLRHPVGVVAAQWSPGSLQHGQYMHILQSR